MNEQLSHFRTEQDAEVTRATRADHSAIEKLSKTLDEWKEKGLRAEVHVHRALRYFARVRNIEDCLKKA